MITVAFSGSFAVSRTYRTLPAGPRIGRTTQRSSPFRFKNASLGTFSEPLGLALCPPVCSKKRTNFRACTQFGYTCQRSWRNKKRGVKLCSKAASVSITPSRRALRGCWENPIALVCGGNYNTKTTRSVERYRYNRGKWSARGRSGASAVLSQNSALQTQGCSLFKYIVYDTVARVPFLHLFLFLSFLILCCFCRFCS